MQRLIVLAVVLSVGLISWVSLSQDKPATEYSSVVVALAGLPLSTQADPVSTELNSRASEGWSLASTDTFVGETGRPVVLLVFSRPVK